MKLEQPVWPNGKKCAVLISLNLNAELFWLQLDPGCANMPKTLSLGQYGMDRGLDRILDILEARGIHATAFVPGRVAALYPDKLKRLALCGHELGVTGYEDENLALYSKAEQKASIQKSIAAIEALSGKRPAGFRTPQGELTLETLQAARELGLVYSSNLSDDDRPYALDLENGDTITELPIHWANYDLPYFAFNYRPAFPAGQGRIANYSGVLSNWTDEFDGAYRYGLLYVLQLDPAAIGAPGRAFMLESLLDHMAAQGGVWFATGEKIAAYAAESLHPQTKGDD